ncbi:ABC transporter ATP-binding protein/permease [uncultured Cardiobacterium sp.]|uniref:ABC transporter ATP-binding protein/permease n=1 Tax=uncultured Cardiobacterium sp. TaxID=417619 RepID=UPI00263006D3|nr:ABC transporter ATP-binding protein/permease [uncultured Cardiobacterium sp.]
MKTLARFLRLIAPYWFTRRSLPAWGLLAADTACTLLLILIGVWIVRWDKRFYDALADFNGAILPALAAEYLGYLALLVTFIVSGEWLRKVLRIRWREQMSRDFQHAWLAEHRHYRLQQGAEPDNPDQRIAEDIALLAEQTLDLLRSFIQKSVTLVTYLGILWGLSGVQTFTIAGYSFTIHGYLVWVALAYSLITTLIGHLIGHKLQALNVERQHREADYRATLLRVRDHSEQIALYRGEAAEEARLQQRFEHIKTNWRALINRELMFSTFTASYIRISIFIPIFATLPMYLAKTLTFGDIMQTRASFARVQDGFGWFLDSYKQLIVWAAVIERLARFQDALEQLPAAKHPATDSGDDSITTENLCIDSADGRPLLGNLNLHATAPERLLLDGASGIGKTTLLRTLAGIWPHYRGHYRLPARGILTLPQRPYLPQDTLRAILCYPARDSIADERLTAALQQVGLDRLAARLDDEAEWQRILSGGEQQRISLARALITRPHILLLDEATNQLDDAVARTLMQTLHETLPHTLCLAISHQPPIKTLFPRCIDLNRHVVAG